MRRGNDAPMSPEMTGMVMTRQPGSVKITDEDVKKAAAVLKKYKESKKNLEDRIIEDEQWWELRHWEVMRKGRKPKTAIGPDGKEHVLPAGPEPSSAWLFNAILNKHADAMDNYPEPVVLPRERDDEQSAKTLSSILPVVMEYNDFEQTYNTNWWEKLKHGTAVYATLWDPRKENGLGDIDIHSIDLLNIFWEPGITDIQDSRNVFIVDLVDNDILNDEYPQFNGKLGGNVIDIAQYVYDDYVDTTNKSVVVDWYYKIKAPDGRTVLHFAKFVDNTLLYASENDEQYATDGWYTDGKYPVDFDVMFPEKGTPVGFGYVAICKDPQLYIDKLSANILESSCIGTKKRYFVSKSTNINKEQFMDISEPIVDVEGEIDDRRIKEIAPSPVNGIYVTVMNQKIEEMKDTAANRDVNSGGAASGITAAAAIAALQEAGNKASRDMIATSYRCYTSINKKAIERMRQFYDATRAFRITGADSGSYEFVDFNNSGIALQEMGVGSDGGMLYRLPVFDLKIKAQKKNPFSRMEQNENAKTLYSMGFFAPERAQEALAALDMMEFEGIEKVREYVSNGDTLLNMAQNMSQQIEQLQATIASLTGAPMMAGGAMQPPAPSMQRRGTAPMPQGNTPGDGLASGVMEAQTPMTGYGQRLAERSIPSVEG